jgi:hypothetical protein
VQLSTSWAFEKALNWKAIHIEGNPANFGKLLSNRPSSINLNYLLCRDPTALHYISPRDGTSAVSGILEYMNPAFVQRFYNSPDYSSTRAEDGKFTFSGLNKTESRVQSIACQSFTSVMKEVNVRHIDVWVLDVEGQY